MAKSLSQIGISTAKQNQFVQKGIASVEELVQYFPRKYYDYRTPRLISDLVSGNYSVVCGTVLSLTKGTPNRVTIQDAAGSRMTIAYFGSYPFSTLAEGESYYFAGKVAELYTGAKSMTNPMITTPRRSEACRILPVYSKIKGMSSDYLEKSIDRALSSFEADYLCGDRDILAANLGLFDEVDAMRLLHSPKSPEQVGKANKRMAFDEIYAFYETLSLQQRYDSVTKHPETFAREKTDAFISAQPFALTDGQRDVIDTIVSRTMSGERLNAIVSGDVGSGKTMVAMSTAVFMAENGYQSIVLAPTLVLAKQHFKDFSEKMPCSVALLTGETKKKEREAMLNGLADGSIDVLVGTHAVLSPELHFAKLGLTVVDEEHKFGVGQKEMLEQFSSKGAHHINMTATPIPRSMAMGVFGSGVDVLPIHTMPKGRKPVKTTKVQVLEQVCDKIREEVKLGHQAYVVCPFIADSDALADVWSVERAKAELQRLLPGLRITSISGDMRGADVAKRVDEFAAGGYDVLVSTTIVEVGVNVPNASVIAVLSANRFGLSALHQLRGRVGRSSDQGYCLLLPDAFAERLDILCRTNDGFEIAEEDMRLRGPGNLLGIEQTGYNKAIDAILRYPRMSKSVRKWIETA